MNLLCGSRGLLGFDLIVRSQGVLPCAWSLKGMRGSQDAVGLRGRWGGDRMFTYRSTGGKTALVSVDSGLYKSEPLCRLALNLVLWGHLGDSGCGACDS